MEEIIKGFMLEKALVLIPVLWIIGAIVKKTPVMPDWLIPYILLAIGAVGGLVTVGVSTEGVIQGILAAGAAVLGHQLVKQTGEAVQISQGTPTNEDIEEG